MNPRIALYALSIATALLLLPSAALAREHTLTAFDGSDTLRWQAVNDGVMGGRSRGDSAPTPNKTLLFSGAISLENNGGFSSIRTRTQDLKLGGHDGLQIRVRGNGRTYKLSLRTSSTSRWIAYWADFETVKGEWTTVRIPFSKWVPTTFGRKLAGPKLDPSLVNSVGFMMYDKKAGPFSLEVDSIVAYREASSPAVIATGGSPTILETATAAGSFKTLLAAAKAAGLVEALSGPGPFTVFAPTDDAFEKLPKGTVESLLEPKNRNALRTVLLHHVIQGNKNLPALLSSPSLKSLGDQRLTISNERGALRIGDATVVSSDLQCENGVIHVVDRVIVPELRDLAGVAAEAGTFQTLVAAAKAAGLVGALTGDDALTVFAPTDAAFAKLPKGTVESLLEPANQDQLKRILLHHVVKGRVYADAAAAAGKAPTLAGTELAIGYAQGLKVGDSRIVQPDIAAKNGVIHVIDTVLLPPKAKGSSAEKSLERDPRRAAESVILTAIDAGVDLFNDGDPATCATVYRIAATALLAIDADMFSQSVRGKLQSAIASTEEPRARAWTLRRALDSALRSVRAGA